MKIFKGKSVLEALAIGEIKILKFRESEIRRVEISEPDNEAERFKNALNKAKWELSDIYERALKQMGEEQAQIFEIHIMMIEDEDYNQAICKRILNEKINAEYAVCKTSEEFAENFAAMDDKYMQARAADVKDISNRLIRCLNKDKNDEFALAEKVIICAEDLAPSETVSLDADKILAFVTAGGTTNSHTAILARSMNIPAIVNVGEDFLKQIKDGDMAIADGLTGQFIVNPDSKTLDAYEKRKQQEEERKIRLNNLIGKDNITVDGRQINIYANIGGVDNIDSVIKNDAGGIGLFRSEFLYLQSTDYPSEEKQFNAYKYILQSMSPKKVIIRTLDIGADKQVDYFHMEKEDNPALGLRAIRLCLARPELFCTQLRALLRASVYGNLGIMFPMITSAAELSEIIALYNRVKSELGAENIEYAENIEIGIMIETPAAAIISDMLAPMVDFFSVGTNDLIQYTLACDRQNPQLERFCNTHHEAILRLIENSAKNIHKNGGWIGICGELAADTSLTKHFLKMGIDELSVSPHFVLKLREIVRNTDLSV